MSRNAFDVKAKKTVNMDEFSLGIGPTNSLFLDSHPMVKALKDAWQVNEARNRFYLKYAKEIASGTVNGASWTNHKVKFGLKGILIKFICGQNH